MADPGSEFRPKQTREARQFEPPPWERDEFDKLAHERAEEDAASLDAVGAAVSAPKESPVAESIVESPTEEAAAAADLPAEDPGEGPVGPDPARVTEMMAVLAAEEPSAVGDYWKVNAAAGMIVVALGVMFVTWGVVALVRSGGSGVAGVFGGATLVLFGGGFAVGGVYVVVKTLRRQGVL